MIVRQRARAGASDPLVRQRRRRAIAQEDVGVTLTVGVDGVVTGVLGAVVEETAEPEPVGDIEGDGVDVGLGVVLGWGVGVSEWVVGVGVDG